MADEITIPEYTEILFGKNIYDNIPVTINNPNVTNIEKEICWDYDGYLDMINSNLWSTPCQTDAHGHEVVAYSSSTTNDDILYIRNNVINDDNGNAIYASAEFTLEDKDGNILKDNGGNLLSGDNINVSIDTSVTPNIVVVNKTTLIDPTQAEVFRGNIIDSNECMSAMEKMNWEESTWITLYEKEEKDANGNIINYPTFFTQQALATVRVKGILNGSTVYSNIGKILCISEDVAPFRLSHSISTDNVLRLFVTKFESVFSQCLIQASDDGLTWDNYPTKLMESAYFDITDDEHFYYNKYIRLGCFFNEDENNPSFKFGTKFSESFYIDSNAFSSSDTLRIISPTYISNISNGSLVSLYAPGYSNIRNTLDIISTTIENIGASNELSAPIYLESSIIENTSEIIQTFQSNSYQYPIIIGNNNGLNIIADNHTSGADIYTNKIKMTGFIFLSNKATLRFKTSNPITWIEIIPAAGQSSVISYKTQDNYTLCFVNYGLTSSNASKLRDRFSISNSIFINCASNNFGKFVYYPRSNINIYLFAKLTVKKMADILEEINQSYSDDPKGATFNIYQLQGNNFFELTDMTAQDLANNNITINYNYIDPNDANALAEFNSKCN